MGEHGNETADSITFWGIEQVNNFWLVKKESSPWGELVS
jgi:hypothetical protein